MSVSISLLEFSRQYREYSKRISVTSHSIKHLISHVRIEET